MSLIDWDQCFSVGHPVVDSQHKEFLNLINALEHVSANDSGSDYRKHCLSILQGLMGFTEKHFRLENGLMQKYGYLDADNHWRSHKNFDMSIYIFYRKVLAGEYVPYLSLYLTLRDKFRKHILTDDKMMFQRLFACE